MNIEQIANFLLGHKRLKKLRERVFDFIVFLGVLHVIISL